MHNPLRRLITPAALLLALARAAGAFLPPRADELRIRLAQLRRMPVHEVFGVARAAP